MTGPDAPDLPPMFHLLRDRPRVDVIGVTVALPPETSEGFNHQLLTTLRNVVEQVCQGRPHMTLLTGRSMTGEEAVARYTAGIREQLARGMPVEAPPGAPQAITEYIAHQVLKAQPPHEGDTTP